MAGSPPGSSSNGYVPIQHPNAGSQSPTYAVYGSTSDWPEEPLRPPPRPPWEMNKPVFSLEEIETAKALITELSAK